MIKRILPFLVLGFVTFSLSAQHEHCGTTTADQQGMIEFIEAYKKSNHIDTRSAEPLYVPIKFHRVANNDGTGRIKSSQVLEQMCVLIEDFKAVDMHLYVDDMSFNNIDNESIYTSASSFNQLTVSQKDDNAVNIFITENADTPGGQGTTLGYYSPNGDYIIIRISDVENETSSLSHELGHFFSLPHTFFGWEGGWNPSDFPDNQVNLMFAPGTNIPVELVDGSNCTIAADRICDTPPDYNFGFGASGCQFNDQIRDKNGDLIDPMEDNFMSYFLSCNEYVFTPEQILVMRANFLGNDRSQLRRSYVPDTTEIISNHEVVTPSSNEQLEYYNNIYLDWTDAEGASNYLVSVTASGETFEFNTTDSEIVIDELTPNKFYFWEVKPWNDGNTCSESISSFFNTGSDFQTSVVETDLLTDFNVYPNPAAIGVSLNVSFTSKVSEQISYNLMDIAGRALLTDNVNILTGENQFRLETGSLSAGVYLLKLNTSNGSILQRVVIR